MAEPSIRPLTRAEQLEWLIPFLESQIEQLKLELLVAKNEYLEVKQAEMQDNDETVKKL